MQRSKGQASKGELWHHRRLNQDNLFGYLLSLGLPCLTKSTLHTPAFRGVLIYLWHTLLSGYTMFWEYNEYNMLGLGTV